MKYYHNSPLLYEKGFSIIINDEAHRNGKIEVDLPQK